MNAWGVRERAPGDEEVVARLVLLRVPGIGDHRLALLERHFGSATGALDVSTASFADAVGIAAARARDDHALRDSVELGLRWARSHGVRVATRGGWGYPRALEALPDPPAVVFVRGDAALLDRPAVALVGSRRSTEYGRRAAEEIAAHAASRDVVVVSGLALGIDGAAHRAALRTGGPTVAVLGTGPDIAYPKVHQRLFERIVGEGAVITEFLPGEPALPHHFPRRNRLIAALSQAVVVVEAAERSGALITAHHAMELGRPVGAVPGSIYSGGSRGTNALLRDGAHPVLGGADALGLLPHSSLRDLPLWEAPDGPDPAGSPVDAGAGSIGRRILAVLDSPASPDELARVTGLDVRVVLGAVGRLELTGLVVRGPGGRVRRA